MQRTWVVVTDPGAVRELFARGPDAVDAGVANATLCPIEASCSSPVLDGSEHLDRRRMIMGPLHGRAMRANAEHVIGVVDGSLDAWPLGLQFAALPECRRISFDLMAQVGLGPPADEGTRSTSAALRDIAFRGSTTCRLTAFDQAALGEIARRRETRDGSAATDLLSSLLRARTNEGIRLSDQQVRDEVVMLILAGYESSSALLAWAIHELARDPVAQLRLHAREPRFADRVIAETLRLHPPRLTVRRLRERLIVGAHDLPEGTFVLLSAAAVHRRRDLYDHPTRFDPDRFGDQTPPIGAWLPYGGGVRRCPGASLAHLQTKLALERIVDRFVLRVSRRRRERSVLDGLVSVPGQGARIVVRPRTA